MQARHEYKHSINAMDYAVLRSRLKAMLPHDAHTDENGEYTVRSLYFDTPDDRALQEKIDGVNNREKFRIRRYSGDAKLYRLEKKSKVNGLCYKQAVSLADAQALSLINGDTSWMIRDGRPLVMELYSKMKTQLLQPKTIVDYIREPFIHRAGNVRVTLDRNIRTGLFSKDFLRADLPMAPVGPGCVLLEVKYDAFIPQFIVNLLQLENRRASACSKYALCRVYD